MSRRRIPVFAAGWLCATLLYACGDGATEPPHPAPDPPRPATVAVAPATIQLIALGATEQLTAEVRNQTGNVMAGAAVSWSSSAAAVAMVSAAGPGDGSNERDGHDHGNGGIGVGERHGLRGPRSEHGRGHGGDRHSGAWPHASPCRRGVRHPVPGVEFAWASSDTLVTVVDDAGHVTSIGPGKTAVRAVAAEVTGQVELTVVAPKGVVLTGTVWVSPDVITDADPSALDSVVYVGRGMRGFYDPFECERRWSDDLVVFLFEAHFAGGATMEVQAHPAYGEAESALAAARQFLPPMGRLPRMLIDGGREVELSPAPDYGFVEEMALHEGSHAVLEDCGWDGCRIDCAGLGGSRSAEWRAAQPADSLFISAYVRDNPESEDMAETL